ncbi:Protein mahjong [Pseudolycoriella hygida]|uniref:Protein mahjong n=1 Tax=Pseudolycoriella hygida TaxID=35572 RepID=A0A9Q0NAS1_9DIPT|nr:Protein mahjong [Pseudolycoriella hygida]
MTKNLPINTTFVLIPCPQLDLLASEHKCLDHQPNKMHDLCSNFADHYLTRQQGYNSRRLDRRYIHSQFCVYRTITAQCDAFFTCCDFTPCGTSVVVGLRSGKVEVYKNENGNLCTTYQCHYSYVNNVKTSKDGTLLLTSSSLFPFSAMWNIEKNQFSKKLSFHDEQYLDFSKLNEDKILGNRASAATIFDTQTGQSIAGFIPSIGNYCNKNRATFSPCDELVLSG